MPSLRATDGFPSREVNTFAIIVKSFADVKYHRSTQTTTRTIIPVNNSTKLSQKPMVSIIIPVFNSAELIRRAANSALSQSFTDFELLVVNDGSSDNTLNVLESYGQRIRVISQQNKGPAAARNHGILESEGNYLAFLDADDYWHKDKLTRQIEVLDNNHRIGFCSTATKIVDEQLTTVGQWPCDAGTEPLLEKLFMHGSAISGSTSGVVARAELIKAVGGFDESLRGFEDPDLWIRLAAITDYYCIEEPLTVVVRTPNSVSRNLNTMRNATLKSLKKNRHLLQPNQRRAFWRTACASALADYAKMAYRAHHRTFALRCILQALTYAPIRRGRLLSSLLWTMAQNKNL